MAQERDIEKHFIQKIESLGGVALKFTVPGQRGWPDRLAILPGGRVIFVELKRPKGGRLSALQIERLRTLTDLGAESYVMNSLFLIDAHFGDDT